MKVCALVLFTLITEKFLSKKFLKKKRNNFQFFPSVADRLASAIDSCQSSFTGESQRKLITKLSRLILIANKLLMNDKNKPLIGCHHRSQVACGHPKSGISQQFFWVV